MMKAWLLFLLLASQSFAAITPVFNPQSACVTASGGSPIPTSYSLSNSQSNILELATNTSATHFAVTTNQLASAIGISLGSASSQTVPANNSANQIFLDASLLPAFDGIKITNQILIRSNTGSTITSGTICILVW